VAALAAEDRINAQVAARATATASNWVALVTGRRVGRGFMSTGPPWAACTTPPPSIRAITREGERPASISTVRCARSHAPSKESCDNGERVEIAFKA
jgi:hypothetical protein